MTEELLIDRFEVDGHMVILRDCFIVPIHKDIEDKEILTAEISALGIFACGETIPLLKSDILSQLSFAWKFYMVDNTADSLAASGHQLRQVFYKHL